MSPSDGFRRGLVVEHARYGPAGRLETWAEARGIALEVVRPAEGELLPAPGGYDFAVVLGADASLARSTPAWVAGELDWVRRADSEGVPLLGICFGAQALADAFGGTVARSPEPEIGWITIDVDPASGVPQGPWFTWHEDRIDPPPGAVELAAGPEWSQVFSLRSHLGVQFHPEVTPAIVDSWMFDDTRRKLRDATPGVLDRPEDAADGPQELAERLFDAFLRRAGDYALAAGSRSSSLSA